jgi:hypothetical protein
MTLEQAVEHARPIVSRRSMLPGSWARSTALGFLPAALFSKRGLKQTCHHAKPSSRGLCEVAPVSEKYRDSEWGRDTLLDFRD